MDSCEQFQSRLSEHVDDLVAGGERVRVEQHLLSCAVCRNIAGDLRRLRDTARRLGTIEPPSHVLPKIAARLSRDGDAAFAEDKPKFAAGRHGTRWQWAGIAAAVVLVALSAYIVARRTPASSSTIALNVGNAPDVRTVESVTDELRQAEAHYDNAIQQLETLTKSNNGSLEPNVAAALHKNLDVIDQAIAESRTALQQEPGSEPARESLFEALQRKVDVLQSTVTLMNESPAAQWF